MKNVFVFPCGSEVALEIARSLADDRHFHLIGGTSISDHGRFVYNDIVDDVPWIDDACFVPFIKNVVAERKVDLIYPATDMALTILKRSEVDLGCRVVTSSIKTVETCLSKAKTYSMLSSVVRTPRVYDAKGVSEYPIFAKPDVGHSSKGVAVICSEDEKVAFLSKNRNILLLEFLPGEEYTVDCFTNRHGELLFSGARRRLRTVNGISVHTEPVPEDGQGEFADLVGKINKKLSFRGAWFAQFKRASDGELVLLEIAARFGGSSGLFRGLGINFALLSLWDALELDVSITANRFWIEMDRALDNKYKLDIAYNEVFVDYDDTIVMSSDDSVNPKVMKFVFLCRNRGVKVTVLSRHKGDLLGELRRHKIEGLFSRVIHICDDGNKAKYIDNKNAIFLDDSYVERANVKRLSNIPVFGLDMLDSLCND